VGQALTELDARRVGDRDPAAAEITIFEADQYAVDALVHEIRPRT
jgi:hypothetical protein